MSVPKNSILQYLWVGQEAKKLGLSAGAPASLRKTLKCGEEHAFSTHKCTHRCLKEQAGEAAKLFFPAHSTSSHGIGSAITRSISVMPPLREKLAGSNPYFIHFM